MYPQPDNQLYADVLLPVAIPRPYTYLVPDEFLSQIAQGVQVEVQFGANKLYSGIVIRLHRQAPTAHKPKPILALLDTEPVVYPRQIQFWEWMSQYYCCTLGEIMHAALPSHLKMASETRIVPSPLFDHSFEGLSDKEFLIMEALTIQGELTVEDVRGILQQKTVYPLLKGLFEKKLILLQEELQTKYQPKTIAACRLREPYASRPDLLDEAFELVARSTRQTEVLLAFVQLSKKNSVVRKQELAGLAKADSGTMKALEKKGILEYFDLEVSRLANYSSHSGALGELTPDQEKALAAIRSGFEENKTVLLHGVTGSGKTRIYVELMREVIRQGGQALYLLPEIALTTQIIQRLQEFFGNDIAVYHSRQSNEERVEIWQSILRGKPIVLGPRSSLFLPFQNLRLVVVDEEHDPSYKQQEPAPRYQGRDAAIYLAHLFGARVLLGTATPSIESYTNATNGKYALVELNQRFGGLDLPEVRIADIKEEQKNVPAADRIRLGSELLEALTRALDRGEQAILFQNRRGYAPTLRCTVCNWSQFCVNCAVTMNYHKRDNHLHCHYCGYRIPLPHSCPSCGARELRLYGFGTQKIEDEIQTFFPEARVARLDLDSARSRNAHSQILQEFAEKRIDILIGTQMVTKGLDFENVAVVGVLSADQLLQFPDFRAAERSFQLMTQVAGRAGRKFRRGRVLIQAMNTAHPVLADVLDGDFQRFYQREILERRQFQYPPFVRLIRVIFKHQQEELVYRAAHLFASHIKPRLKKRMLGPEPPFISRVRGLYLQEILLKLERDPTFIRETKTALLEAVAHLHRQEGCSTVRVVIDVDPE